MNKLAVILFGITAAICASFSMVPDASGSPDRSCGNGQPILSRANAHALIATQLRKEKSHGAMFTATGLKILQGKSPVFKPDAEGESSGFEILSYNFDDPPTPDRQLQSKSRTTGSGQTSFWCGYGVGTVSHWFVLPGDYIGSGQWVDLWWRSGTKIIASAWCPYWATYCDGILEWTPSDVRLAMTHFMNGTGTVGLYTKNCFWN